MPPRMVAAYATDQGLYLLSFLCYSVFLFQFVLTDPKLIASWP
jgi:hypothetical protein